MTIEATEPRRRMSAARKTLLLGTATALAVIVGAVAATTFVNDEQAFPPPEAYQPDGTRLGPVSGTESTPLPDTALPAFYDDTEVRLSEYQGSPLVVNFWATWCPPCVAEMPDFQAVADELAGRVAVVGVNAQDNHEQAQRFVAELGITYELVRDPRGHLPDQGQPLGVHQLVLLLSQRDVELLQRADLALPHHGQRREQEAHQHHDGPHDGGNVVHPALEVGVVPGASPQVHARRRGRGPGAGGHLGAALQAEARDDAGGVPQGDVGGVRRAAVHQQLDLGRPPRGEVGGEAARDLETHHHVSMVQRPGEVRGTVARGHHAEVARRGERIHQPARVRAPVVVDHHGAGVAHVGGGRVAEDQELHDGCDEQDVEPPQPFHDAPLEQQPKQCRIDPRERTEQPLIHAQDQGHRAAADPRNEIGTPDAEAAHDLTLRRCGSPLAGEALYDAGPRTEQPAADAIREGVQPASGRRAREDGRGQ